MWRSTADAARTTACLVSSRPPMSASTVSMLPGVTRAWEHNPCNESEGAWEEWTGAGWLAINQGECQNAGTCSIAEARNNVQPGSVEGTTQADAAAQSKHAANSPSGVPSHTHSTSTHCLVHVQLWDCLAKVPGQCAGVLAGLHPQANISWRLVSDPGTQVTQGAVWPGPDN